uniref:Pirin n=1 Tax=Hucho hucho TaxID=62062 RepID=A0A4W5Q9G7_9TELE
MWQWNGHGVNTFSFLSCSTHTALHTRTHTDTHTHTHTHTLYIFNLLDLHEEKYEINYLPYYVTYVLKGVSAHEDFCGHSGLLKPGDLQVEKHLVTLTVMYVVGCCLECWGSMKLRNTIKVLSFFFVQSKIFTRTPTLYLDFKLDGGAKHVQPSCILFSIALSGPDAEQQKVEPHHTIVFDDGDCIAVENKTSEVSHFVLIAGQPINEPVVQHGPFVMNTEEEINQAVRDYRTGTNGFERAKAWRSKIRDSFEESADIF